MVDTTQTHTSPFTVDFRQRQSYNDLENQVLNFWDENDTFKKSVEQRPENQPYIFYDGPPFATGLPHYGHLLASTMKDIVPRYWTMKGFRVERTWGWDCHGIPIENMIEKELNIQGGKKGIEEMGIGNFNAACRAAILRFDKEWEKVIRRLGRWVDFKNSYKTMDNTYIESIWWAFKNLWEKGLVYEGKKVILYCSRCATPLSNFEIAMDNSYKQVIEPSTTYKYKLANEENTYLLAWSTTPWNKLATPALAVNPELEYVKVKQGNEFYILAKSRLVMLGEEVPYKIVESYKGKELEGRTFEPQFNFVAPEQGKRMNVVVADTFVTDDEGTGVVTLAIYGEEDYRVMQEHNIQLIEHVDEEGKLKPFITKWAGMGILEANPLIDEDLASRNLIYKHEKHTHSVPVCYRCGTRLYYAPVPAWFINIQQLKPQLLENNESINWYPAHLKHGRFGKGLETAPDWNISRSRYWGSPMPIWVGEKTGKKRIIGSMEELKKWAVNPEVVSQVNDYHREFLDPVEVWVDDEKTEKGKRIPEVFDCWVESGSMPYAAMHYPFENKDKFEKAYPAQFISEYIAQTRAWFYTLHVMSVGLFGKPAFENALTTGTILAEDGTKMSKSKKNYPDPMLLIEKYGVDSLRLYMTSSVVMKADNLNFSETAVEEIKKKVFDIWWNVLSFYVLYADKSQSLSLPKASEVDNVMDKWMISRVERITKTVTHAMDSYDVVEASRTLMEFVSELSTWYLRLSRDRLKEENNRQVSQVFGAVLYRLAVLFAPFAPFFSEVVFQQLSEGKDHAESVHLELWPVVHEENILDDLEQHMELIKKVVEQSHAARRDQKLKVRQPLAKVEVTANEKPSEAFFELLQKEINVENVVWNVKSDATTVSVVLDTNLTPELMQKGKMREAIRQIQDLRKAARVPFDAVIDVQLPDWPLEFEEQIKEKTLVNTLQKGENPAILQ